MICRRVPSPSCRVAKHSLPELRMNTTRPTTATWWPLDSPVGRSANRSRTAASESVRSGLTG